MPEVSKMEIFSPYTHTGCCFPASTPGTDKLLLSMVAIPVDPLLYFSCSIVRKPGDVQVLRSANREKPFLGWQPEVLRILRRFLSTYVYYIIHDSTYTLHVVTTDIYLHISGYSSARGILCACVFLVNQYSPSSNEF